MPVGLSAANQGSAGTTLATGAITTQANNGCGVVGVVGDTGFFTSLVDSFGNTWTQINSELADGTSANASRMYYAQNMAGGAGHTVTLNKSSGSFAAIFFLELINMLTTGVLDQQDRILDTATPFNSPVINTVTNNEILVACSFADDVSNNNYVQGNSFTNQQQQTNGATSWTGAIASRVVTSTGAYNSTVTRTGAARVHSWIASFRENVATPVPVAWLTA